MTDLRLRPMRVDDERAVRAAQEELAADDFTFALFLDDLAWPDYLARLQGAFDGTAIPEGMVRAALLVAEVDGEIVGRTSIRFELNDWLFEHGGHVGYGVRPGFRRRGYAGEILRQSLVVLRAHGVGRVLVTCNEDNAGSIATIEGRGGVLDPDRPATVFEGHPARRYWID